MSATADASTALDMTRSFFAAYNRHDVSSMVAACSERAELRYVPMGSYGRGKVHELGKAIWSGLIDALPDLHVAVQSMFGGASNIAAEVMIGGTQRKDLVYGQVRIRSQGKHYELPHACNRSIADRRFAFALTNESRARHTLGTFWSRSRSLAPSSLDNRLCFRCGALPVLGTQKTTVVPQNNPADLPDLAPGLDRDQM